MTEKRLLAVSGIKISDIAADGGVGTAFESLGTIYKGTATFEQTEAEDIEHEAEELDDPIEVLLGGKRTTVKWGITNFAPANLVKVLGGSVTGTGADEKWNAPDSSELIEKSVEITPKKGGVITVVRMLVKANITYALSKEGIGQVMITAKMMTPTKAGTAPFTIGV